MILFQSLKKQGKIDSRKRSVTFLCKKALIKVFEKKIKDKDALEKLLKELNQEKEENQNHADLESQIIESSVVTPPSVLKEAPKIKSSVVDAGYMKKYSLQKYDFGGKLKQELISYKEWWSRQVNSSRQGVCLSEATLNKRVERVLSFLGYVAISMLADKKKTISFDSFNNHQLFEKYLLWHSDVRSTKPGTLIEHISAAVSVIKFINRDNLYNLVGKKFGNLELIQRYRDMRNGFQTKSARSKKNETSDELKEQNKWLDWLQFKSMVAKLEKKTDLTNHRPVHDLLLLKLYEVQPARSSEVRLLQYIEYDALQEVKGNKTTRQYVEDKRINVITKRYGTTWTSFVANSKNSKKIGVDVTEFTTCDSFVKSLELYLELRPKTLGHEYLFTTRNGTVFDGQYFSSYLGNLIERESGQRMTSNLIRSSFISHFHDVCDDEGTKESVAKLMRHSVREASKTYDRRNQVAQKKRGMEYIQGMDGKTEEEQEQEEVFVSSKKSKTNDKKEAPPAMNTLKLVILLLTSVWDLSSWSKS